MAYLTPGVPGLDGGQLTRRPAVVIVGWLLAAGPVPAPHQPRRHGVAWTLLVQIPKTVVGLVLLNLGYIGVALGIWEWLDPRGFSHVATAFGQTYDLSTVGRSWRGWFGLRN